MRPGDGPEPQHRAAGLVAHLGPLRDAFNHGHGWSRPDDPARARVQQPGHRAYVDAARLRAGLERETNPRDLIRDYLRQRVERGAVRDRSDVTAALEEAGLEVDARATATSPSVIPTVETGGGLISDN